MGTAWPRELALWPRSGYIRRAALLVAPGVMRRSAKDSVADIE